MEPIISSTQFLGQWYKTEGYLISSIAGAAAITVVGVRHASAASINVLLPPSKVLLVSQSNMIVLVRT